MHNSFINHKTDSKFEVNGGGAKTANSSNAVDGVCDLDNDDNNKEVLEKDNNADYYKPLSKRDPIRQCEISRIRENKTKLLRFVQAPADLNDKGLKIVFDAKGKLPGRGHYVLPSKQIVERFLFKNFSKIMGAKVPDELVEQFLQQVQSKLKQEALSELSLLKKRGALVFRSAEIIDDLKEISFSETRKANKKNIVAIIVNKDCGEDLLKRIDKFSKVYLKLHFNGVEKPDTIWQLFKEFEHKLNNENYGNQLLYIDSIFTNEDVLSLTNGSDAPLIAIRGGSNELKSLEKISRFAFFYNLELLKFKKKG